MNEEAKHLTPPAPLPEAGRVEKDLEFSPPSRSGKGAGGLGASSDSHLSLPRLLAADLRAKARWVYEHDRWPALVKVLLTDGTMAMILYRLMQWARRWRVVPLEMVFNKLNAACCHCVIGRGAE